MDIQGQCAVELHDAKTNRLISRQIIKNLFVMSGRSSVASLLAGRTMNGVGQITYCAVGTGSNAPALNDTRLQTELFRKEVSLRSASSGIAVFRTFFNSNQANDVLLEAGLFGDAATGSSGSGTLYARLPLSFTKTSDLTLTLTWLVGVGVEFIGWDDPAVDWASLTAGW
jgi:hypothetical protein